MTKTTTKRNQQGRNSGNTLATALANSGSKRSSERIKQRTSKADTASANDSSGSKGRECKSPALSKPRTGTFAVFGQSTPPTIRLQKGQPATGTVTEPTDTGIPAGQEGSLGVPSPTNTTNGVTQAGVLNGNGHGTDAATSKSGTEASPLKDTAKVLFDPKVHTTASADGKSTKEASKGVERTTKHKADDRVDLLSSDDGSKSSSKPTSSDDASKGSKESDTSLYKERKAATKTFSRGMNKNAEEALKAIEFADFQAAKKLRLEKLLASLHLPFVDLTKMTEEELKIHDDKFDDATEEKSNVVTRLEDLTVAYVELECFANLEGEQRNDARHSLTVVQQSFCGACSVGALNMVRSCIKTGCKHKSHLNQSAQRTSSLIQSGDIVFKFHKSTMAIPISIGKASELSDESLAKALGKKLSLKTALGMLESRAAGHSPESVIAMLHLGEEPLESLINQEIEIPLGQVSLTQTDGDEDLGEMKDKEVADTSVEAREETVEEAAASPSGEQTSWSKVAAAAVPGVPPIFRPPLQKFGKNGVGREYAARVTFSFLFDSAANGVTSEGDHIEAIVPMICSWLAEVNATQRNLLERAY